MSLYADYMKERLHAETIEFEGGFVVYSIQGPECFIREAYIRPESRRNKGASLLFQAVEDKARAAGCTFMSGSVDPKAAGATEALHVGLHFGMKLAASTPLCIWLRKDL